MDKELDVQLLVRETKNSEGYTEYRVQAADFEGFTTHDIYEKIGAIDVKPLDEIKWALVNTELYTHSDEWCAIEVVPVPVLTYHGTGQCTRCNEPNYLFSVEKVSQALYDDMGERKIRCINCVSSAFSVQVGTEIKRGYTPMQWRGMQRWIQAYQASIIQSVKVASAECGVCKQVMLDNDSPSAYRMVEVKDMHDQPVNVHTMCSVLCRHCDITHARYSPWIYSDTRRFHDNYNVFGKDTCRRCYERFNDEYELFRCEGCGSMQDEEFRVQFGREFICKTCYDNSRECDDCGEEYLDNQDHYCAQSPIHDYSYTPTRLIFHKTRTWHDKARGIQDNDADKHLFFGFELEVECDGDLSRANTARKAYDLFSESRVYCKSDGSLNNGIEIVTHPHTLAAYQQDFNWAGLNELSRTGAKSWNTNTCGLHVHVSRKTFGLLDKHTKINDYQDRMPHMIRFAKLIYDNESMITQLAGRSSDDYASFSDKGYLIGKFKGGSDNRFQAVNNCPNVTLEVRVFRGSLRPTRVLSAIELVHAAVEYTRNMKVKPNSFTWVSFMGYLSANMETYPNLFTIMNELFRRGYSEGDI